MARARLYDDIGCMATDPVAAHGQGERYVQMAGGKGWARADDVTFAAPSGEIAAGLQLLRLPGRGVAPARPRPLGTRLARPRYRAEPDALSHPPASSSSRATSSAELKKWHDTRTPPMPDV